MSVAQFPKARSIYCSSSCLKKYYPDVEKFTAPFGTGSKFILCTFAKEKQ
jgi:hypothetical protein